MGLSIETSAFWTLASNPSKNPHGPLTAGLKKV
jgi:hypothetical protein